MHGNKKGPENKGSKTGRGLGYCSGSKNPGFESNEAPMGMRRGNGRGMGRGAEASGGMGRGPGRGMGRGLGRGQGFRANNIESENAEIKTRLDNIEALLKELKK